MKKKKLTKVQLAKQMKTSRSALERLLDPDNVSVTLLTLERAAKAWVKVSGLNLPPSRYSGDAVLCKVIVRTESPVLG
jgi:transcriptional regulator with XRE-family HTH domain